MTKRPTLRLSSADPSLATMHLCAAAYLDRGFRDRVIDEVYQHPENAVAPNPGCDAEPILGHMLQARRYDVLEQGLLACLLLLALVIPAIDKIAFAIGLAVWLGIGIALLVLESVLNTTPAQRRLRAGALVGRRNAMVVVILGLVAAVVFAYLTGMPEGGADAYAPDSTYEFESGYDYSYDPEYEAAAEPEGPSAGLAVFWLLLAGGCAIAFGAARARGLGGIAEGVEPAANDRVKAIGRAQRSQVVTYAASRRPFVGSGQNITTWQFALAVRALDANGPDPAIDPVDLNRHIKGKVAALGARSKGPERLPGLRLADRVYVSGRDVDAPVLEPSALRASGYDFDDVADIQRDPTTPVRHYLRCELVSWDGELVTTIFCHFALQGESLYVEFSSYLLPPTPERYHVFNRDRELMDHAQFWAGVRSSALMPVNLVRSPFDAVVNTVRGIRNWRIDDGASDPVAMEDCGALVGVRELGMGQDRQNYFQYRDSIKYTEILERQILAALTEYLREHGVDTAELEERVNTIVNHGVINYGEMAAGAIGKGANTIAGSIGGGSHGTVSGGG